MDNPTWRRIVSFGSEGTQAGNFSRPWGVAIMRYSDLAAAPSRPWTSYLIAVADRSNNRVQVFEFDAITTQVTFLHMFGDGPGNRHGQFDRPAGIVFNPTLEQIIVADKDNHRVQVFDLSGSYLMKFGERGSKCGQLNYPWDIDVCNATHNILVSDTRNKRIQIFNKFGCYLAHFDQPLDSPRGVAYLSPTQALVSDFNKHRLVLITKNEHEDQQVSSTSLMTPNNNKSYLSNGTIYLNNNNDNHFLQNHESPFGSLPLTRKAITRAQPIAAGTKLRQMQHCYESKTIGFGEGSSWGEFSRPQGVATNKSIVFCSDSRNNRVACCNTSTQSFSYISRDVVDLDRPAGLAAIDNYVVIVDFGNNRIHICHVCQTTGHQMDLFSF